MSDLLGSILTISFVLVFLVIAEGLAKLDRISKENARKLIHISVGNVVFFVPIFETRWIAAGIPALFVLGNYLLSPMSPIEPLRLRTFKAGHSWGTILYPLSLSAVVFIFFSTPYLIVAAFFPVVYGDGFAAVYGPKATSGKFTINGNQKTLIGTSIVSFFSLNSVILGIIFLGYSPGLAILLGSIVAIITPVIELLSYRGTDNLTIPILLSIILGFIQDSIQNAASSIELGLYVASVSFGLLLAIGGYAAGFLTSDGAVTGYIINSMMFGLGGYVIGVQLFLFFILGSGATKLVNKLAKRTQDEFEKGGTRRDALQALAKAGVPALLALLLVFDRNLIYLYMITGILAAALIDTMSTEVGIATKGTPVHILTPWRRANPGQTGVISLKGTLGGIGFGILFLLITYVTALLDPYTNYELSMSKFLLLPLIGGILGMFSDSILGTTLQRHNRCQECDRLVEAAEHHGKPAVHDKGISWFNNDLTNVVGSTLGGIFTAVFYILSM